MFGFLFKRSAKPAVQPNATDVAPQTALRAEAKQAVDQARQQALLHAEALTDEAGAVSFILQSGFADARLRAAQWVQSRAALEQVLQASRNIDRRVAKLMQARLDAVQQQEQVAQKAEACVALARCLLQEQLLMSNHVADLDRAWESKDVPHALQQQFTQLRTALAERLTAQASLQRTAMGLLASVRDLHQQMHAQAGADNAQFALQLDALEAQMAACSSHAEAPNLPKYLATDFAQEIQAVRKLLLSLQQHQHALQARHDLLLQWEASNPDANLEISVDSLKSAWRKLPALPPELQDAALEQRYQALLQKYTVVSKPKKEPAPPASTSATEPQQPISEALDGLEKALEDGSLQVAVDFDKTLRAMDFKTQKPTAAQTARLTQARSELGRLQDWARWGGNISREELMKAAQELPAQALPPVELAKKIGSLRARWKSLDASAGSAPRALWEGFDAACTTAHEAVIEHRRKMAEQRQANQVHAQELIDLIRQYAEVALQAEPSPDWKAILKFCRKKQMSWAKLGPVNHSQRKPLEAAYKAAMQLLLAPLEVQQQIEKNLREQLIAAVEALSVSQRDTEERLRELLQRWTDNAKRLPLPREDEIPLWDRFSSAYELKFAQRKEVTSSADAGRRDNLRLKEELCALLEVAVSQPEAGLPKLLQQAQLDWNRYGQVPRAAEAQIEARYRSAATALQTKLDQSLRIAAEAQSNALRDKLILCQKVEALAAVETIGEASQDWRDRWQALSALAPPFEKIMTARFGRALHQDGNYLAMLENNREFLLQELLRAEILAGIDSPPALARERLQLQVEVLQTSLKAGPTTPNAEQQLVRLCELPAQMDEATLQRLLQLVAVLKAGKR
ncbi:DUF349 domain-containing protein [Paraherbaspirillum soli]|uniref:DUF349 domain-containing protein n=1 Tax=Paraherbaspirillum soli TaxID=631222 RepID=A0ABW0MEG5_9BURK